MLNSGKRSICLNLKTQRGKELLLALAAGAQGLPDLGDISSATLSDQQERTIGNRIMREVRNDAIVRPRARERRR